MGIKNEDGQVTVFLSIILMAIVLVIGVLIDGARIRTGEVNVKRAVESSVKSSLASYSSKLKNDYGLFALSENDGDKLKETIKGYIEKNLMIPSADDAKNEDNKIYNSIKDKIAADTAYTGGRNISLYDFKVEDIKVTPIFNLSQNEVTRNQILEYMKYRAPKEVVQGLWERLVAVRDASKMSDSYKKKIDVDKKLNSLGKNQEKLKKYIDGNNGDGNVETYYVNKFNSSGEWDTEAENYSFLVGNYKQQLSELKGIESEIAALNSALSASADKDSQSSLRSSISAEYTKKNQLEEKINECKGKIAVSFKRIYEDLTDNYVNPNKAAISYVQEIVMKGQDIKKAVDVLDLSLKENFGGENSDSPKNSAENSGNISEDFNSEMKADSKDINEMIPDEGEGSSIQKDLQGNIDFLESAKNTLNKFQGEVNAMNEGSYTAFVDLSEENILKSLKANLGSYKNNIVYNYKKPAGSEKDKALDTRKTVTNQLKGIKSEGADIDLKKLGISMEDLPSVKKVQSRDFSKEDKSFLNNVLSLNALQKLIQGNVEYTGDLSDLSNKAEFGEDEKEGFSDDAFGFISALGSRINMGLTGLRDEIYIDEYIMGTFKNSVPVLKQDNQEKKDTDLSGKTKEDRNTVFDSEVEYILYGSASQNTNKTMAKAQILLIRFAMDTLHVYLDSEKKELASGVAAALTGWWTAGAGIPIASNLIMCGWGMGEALIDLNHLMNGEAVPFLKMKGDWESNILPDKSGAKANKSTLYNYHDYLNLFLLFKDSNEKINRIEDLVEINLRKNNKDFQAGKYNTYIRVEATVSMNYLFLTQAFIPKSIKTQNGRHKFDVVIYQGY